MTQPYAITLEHDRGRVTVYTIGQSITHAIKAACLAENAPERAVVSAKRTTARKMGSVLFGEAS